MTGAAMALAVRWASAAAAVIPAEGCSKKMGITEDGVVWTYRTTPPPGSPVAGRVAQVFISDDGMAMTRSDGSKRHEVEAITDTAAGRLEAALRIREWLGGPAMTGVQ